MSFVNMMGNDRWTDLDINRRVQAIVRSQFTAEDELKAARLVRQSSKSGPEIEFIASVDAAIAAALDEGHAARTDMALLQGALDVENAQRRLARPELEHVLDESGNLTNQAELDQDAAERAAANAEIAAASPEVMDLVSLRNPAPVDAQP